MSNNTDKDDDGSSSFNNISVVKSCEDKINEQPQISSTSSDKPQGRTAKSYNSGGSGWDQMTKQQQKVAMHDWGKQFKKQQQPQQKIKRQKDQGKFIGDRKFTQQIIDSESVSLHQSLRSNNENFEQYKNQEPNITNKKTNIDTNMSNMRQQQNNNVQNVPKKVHYFNIMLVGGGSTGKTTYINCLLRQYKQNQLERQILDPTKQITQHSLNPSLKHLNLQASIIDTPGYKASTFKDYLQLIYKQISNRNLKFRQEYNKNMRVSSLYSSQERQVKDYRIHCCLLFFRGPRIHGDDWQLLKFLQNLTNVIPIIARGDCYTITEVKQLKKNIVERAKTQMVNWFDAIQYIRQKHPEILPKLQQGPYGRSPPFMIVGSNTHIDGNGQLKLSRQYRWGTCYIQNQSHTEFNTLNRLLFDYFREGLVKLIEIKEKTRQDENVERIEKKGRHYLIIGVIVGVTSIAGFAFFKGHQTVASH